MVLETYWNLHFLNFKSRNTAQYIRGNLWEHWKSFLMLGQLVTIFVELIFSIKSFFFFFFRFSVAPAAYGNSQTTSQIRATVAGLCHSHSNGRSELRLEATIQLTATPDPLTHWTGPEIEPTSSWILIRFVSTESQGELLESFFRQVGLLIATQTGQMGFILGTLAHKIPGARYLTPLPHLLLFISDTSSR